MNTVPASHLEVRGAFIMTTLPASYLEVRCAFIMRRITFKWVADQLGTSPQFVRQTLRTFWGRTDLPITGELSHKVMAFTEDLLSNREPPACTMIPPDELD